MINFKKGDNVIAVNVDAAYNGEPAEIMAISQDGKTITIEMFSNGKEFTVTPSEIKHLIQESEVTGE